MLEACVVTETAMVFIRFEASCLLGRENWNSICRFPSWCIDIHIIFSNGTILVGWFYDN